MARAKRILFADLRVGMEITLHHNDGHGKGGTIVEVNLPDSVRLVSGTGRYDNTQPLAEWHYATVEVAQPAEDCLDYDPDTCSGAVELRCTPGGGSFDRCEFHSEQRWERYNSEDSSERYANCSTAPDWFDPANAGEHWDSDY